MTQPSGDPALAPRAFEFERTFEAPRDLVFRAWTEAEHLGHWWGPKGMTVRVLSADVRPGGIFHYSMAPDGRLTGGIPRTNHHVEFALAQLRDQTGHLCRKMLPIGIHEDHDRAGGGACTGLDGGAVAFGIRMGNDARTGRTGDTRGVVSRAVVDHQEFRVGVQPGEFRHNLPDDRRLVACRHDNAERTLFRFHRDGFRCQ